MPFHGLLHRFIDKIYNKQYINQIRYICSQLLQKKCFSNRAHEVPFWPNWFSSKKVKISCLLAQKFKMEFRLFPFYIPNYQLVFQHLANAPKWCSINNYHLKPILNSNVSRKNLVISIIHPTTKNDTTLINILCKMGKTKKNC